ncbi:MAG: lytic transglycosylase domain-containing protein [Mycobacteriales bacterium]
MTHRDTREHRLLVVGGHRARVIAAAVGLLISLGVPVVLLGAPGLTAQGRTAAPPDDTAGLGITVPPPGSPPDMEAYRGNGIVDSSDMPPYRGGVAVSLGVRDGPLGIPGVVLGAYRRAEGVLAGSRVRCHLSWSVLAGIGRIESGHADGGRVDAAGNTLGPILGPRLDGSPGMAAIPDTDHGVLDGDTVWDRAVGPMQFIPSSWRDWGVGNPDNIYDSTLAAGRYLCAGGVDLSDPAQLHAAVLRYNHSETYVDVVLGWAHAYLSGVIPTPSAPGSVPPGTTGNGGRPITTNPAPPPPAVVVAQPTPLASTLSTTTPSPPPPATTSTLPPPAVTSTLPPPSATTTSPLPMTPVTTTAPVPTTPLPSPSPTTDPPPTNAL